MLTLVYTVMVSENMSHNTLSEQLLELAMKSGAEAAEVYESRSLSRPVFFEANRLKQLETSQSEGTALRLWYNGRPGLGGSKSCRPRCGPLPGTV